MSLEDTIEHSVDFLGEDSERMKFVYSQANELIPEFLDELGIKYEPRSFGVIVKSKRPGGSDVLRRLQERTRPVITDCLLNDFSFDGDRYVVSVKLGDEERTVFVENLVLATGGYGGTFENTNNVRYNEYNVFDLVVKNGGQIASLESLFMHPFGHNNGKRILIGAESSQGEFVDDFGDPVFSPKVDKYVKNDDYHEHFQEVIQELDACRAKGSSVRFLLGDREETIVTTVHYTSGGIVTDLDGRVKDNLFAIGECVVNGSRNNGRLPGYPFTSAVVYAKHLTEVIS